MDLAKEQIARNKQIKDSVELAERKQVEAEAKKIAATVAPPVLDTVKPAVVVSDSTRQIELQKGYRDFYTAVNGKDDVFQLENNLVKIYIGSKGGQIQKVELKEYKRANSDVPLVLFDKDSTNFSLQMRAYENTQQFSTADFYFKLVKQDANSCVLRLETARPGSYIEYTYSLKPDDYMVKSSVRFVGMQSILSSTEDQMQMSWSMVCPSQEEHVELERKAADIYYSQTNAAPITSIQ